MILNKTGISYGLKIVLQFDKVSEKHLISIQIRFSLYSSIMSTRRELSGCFKNSHINLGIYRIWDSEIMYRTVLIHFHCTGKSLNVYNKYLPLEKVLFYLILSPNP